MKRYNITKNLNSYGGRNNYNTSNVTSVNNMFSGATSVISLFNNGQIITGTTAPMGWTFNTPPTSSNYRSNCRLTISNKPDSLS